MLLLVAPHKYQKLIDAKNSSDYKEKQSISQRKNWVAPKKRKKKAQ